uniref:Large ribosomal subunit protein uL23m n=1 Tax=Equus asinus TaxID=9793 RepID=A0A9L0IVN7_EQUAS
GGRSVRRRPGGGQVRLRCWGGAVGVGADQVAVRCGSGTQGGAVGVRCRPGGCQVGVRCGQVQAGRGPARVLPGARGRCARGRAGRACPSFRPRPRKRRWRGTCCESGCGARSRSRGDPGPQSGYPLYQLGNPQLRVFRTNFFVRLVRPGTAQPEDTVQFRIPMEMTRVDLRNYLERIYNVPVAAVRTRVQHGSNRKRDHRNVRIKKPDYKVAYVQLAHGQTFTFPDLFPEKKQSEGSTAVDEDIQDKFLEEQRERQRHDPRRGGVPNWFGL